MTKEQAIAAYRLLASAKLAGLGAQEKFAVVRAVAKLKPIASAFEDFLGEAREKLKPEDWGETEALLSRYGELEAAEKAKADRAVAAYNAEVEQCALRELAEDAQAAQAPIGEETLAKLLDANPEWNVAQIMALQALG